MARKAASTKPTGRPSEFTQEVGDAICEALIDGQSLRAICDRPGMPSKSTVLRWLATYETFRTQYTYAREEQAETYGDELVTIADGELGAEDSSVLTQRDRLRVETRKWVASKLKPKKYGDKVQTEISGPDGGPLQVTAIDASQLSTEALKELLSVGRTQVHGG